MACCPRWNCFPWVRHPATKIRAIPARPKDRPKDHPKDRKDRRPKTKPIHRVSHNPNKTANASSA